MTSRILRHPAFLALAATMLASGCDCGDGRVKDTPNLPQLCVEPASGVDFGAVMVGSSATQPLKLTNCGELDFTISALALTEDATSAGLFQVQPSDLPALPLAFNAGASLTLPVTFRPTRTGPFSAHLHVETEYASQDVPVYGRGGPPPCGSGGNRPTAKIDMKANGSRLAEAGTVPPLTTVTLDGSSSLAPDGGPRFNWTLTQKPGSQALQVGPAYQAELFAAESGDYEASLVVTDQNGCASEPALARFTAKSDGALHVELTWLEPHGDVDLHFVGPGGRFGDDGTNGNPFTLNPNGTDCFYADCKLNPTDHSQDTHSIDWGLGGKCKADGNPGNDPTLDFDDLWGNGPENLTVDRPFDAIYSIVVTYYCSRANNGAGPNAGPANAIVKIFVDGILKQTLEQRLTQRDIWTVATVRVSGGQVSVLPVVPPPVLPKSTAAIDACTDARN